MAGVEDERTTEARELSMLVMEASNALVDLRMLPIQDIPKLSKTAHGVMAAASLILEHIREGHAFDAVPVAPSHPGPVIFFFWNNYKNICIYIHVYVYIYIYICVCMYTYIYVYTHTHIHTDAIHHIG
jgi:hypothetical protein